MVNASAGNICPSDTFESSTVRLIWSEVPMPEGERRRPIFVMISSFKGDAVFFPRGIQIFTVLGVTPPTCATQTSHSTPRATSESTFCAFGQIAFRSQGVAKTNGDPC